MTRVLSSSASIEEALQALCDWGDSLFVFWGNLAEPQLAQNIVTHSDRLLVTHLGKISRAVMQNQHRVGDGLFTALASAGVVRFTGLATGHLSGVIAQSGTEFRALLGHWDGSSGGSLHPLATVISAGMGTDLGDDLSRLRRQISSNSHVPTRAELTSEAAAVHNEPEQREPSEPLHLPSLETRGAFRTLEDKDTQHRAFQTFCETLGLNAATFPRWHRNGALWFRARPHVGIFEVDLRTHSPKEDDDEQHYRLSINLEPPSPPAGAVFANDESGAGRTALLHLGATPNDASATHDIFWARTRYARVGLDTRGGVFHAAPLCWIDDPALPRQLASFVSEIRRVGGREILEGSEALDGADIEKPIQFIELDQDHQLEWVHLLLRGQGALERDEAIRFFATSCREFGFAAFQRLRRESALYKQIDRVITHGLRENEFDSPQRGTIRAITDELNDDDWRHCVLESLGDEEWERDALYRESAEFAAEHYGLEFKRLRSDGIIIAAVKSAINSLIRRRLVEASGKSTVRRVRLA